MSVSSSLPERLPADVLLYILHLLSYHDILSMRKTCRILAAISRQRGLWVNRLKAICEENTVFLASFPLERMSLDELEAVTSGPIRFASLMKRYGGTEDRMEQVADSALIPRHERTLTFDVSSSQDLVQDLTSSIPGLYLIPGGRFLVLDWRSILQLWDLGVFLTEGSRKDPKFLAQHVSSADNPWLWGSIHSNTVDNSESIRLVQYNTDLHTIQVFEIFPSAPNPEFKVLRTAQTSLHELVCTSVCGNLLVIVCTRVVKVWNFVDNTWACFCIENPPVQIITSPTTMSLIHTDGISLWDIPRLTIDGHDDGPDTKKPLHFVAYPSGSGPPENVEDDASSHFSGLCDWYTGSRQPLWFDYQHHDQPDTLRSFLLDVAFSPSLQQNTLSLDSLSKILLPEYCFPSDALPSRVVGGKQLRIFETDYGVACHSVQEIDGVAEDLFLEIDLVQESSLPLAEIQTLCPFSGRACFYPLPSESSVEVRILDFFTPPM